MNRYQNVVLAVLFFLCVATPASAATLYMDPNQHELKRGDSAIVSVRLDTDEEECVNVVDAVISYSENIEPIDISRGSSILSIWVEDPVIDKVNRTISFAGGIPNGYCGRIAGDPRLTNNLIDIHVMSPGMQVGSTESGNIGSLTFADETRVLLNDGFGTEASRQLFNSEFILTRDAGSQVENDWLQIINNDEQPPEDFTIALERTPNAFSNRYFIVFNTTDKQSGLALYEVMEEPLELRNLFIWGRANAPWTEARSPYVLEDQSLNSTIRVRAIDKAGNEYVAVLVPDEASRTLPSELYVVAAAAVAGLLILVAALYFVIRAVKRRLRRGQDEGEDDDESEDAEE